MEYWQRWDDKKFNTEEEAYEDYLLEEDVIYLQDTIKALKLISFSDLLDWAMKQPAFWENFDGQIAEARTEAFNELYCHWEEPDWEGEE